MFKTSNELARQAWFAATISKVSNGATILDAGAGKLKNWKYCEHLRYVSHDVCQYDGKCRHCEAFSISMCEKVKRCTI